jgi:dCMP deaminase
MDCARAIVQAGLVELIAFEPDIDDPMWGEHFRSATEMMAEAKVVIRFINHPPVPK